MKKTILISLLAFSFFSCAPKKTETSIPAEPIVKSDTGIVEVCKVQRDKLRGMNENELYLMMTTTGVGNCYVQDAKKCKMCNCRSYVKVKNSTWAGHGWPLNDQTSNSTGCTSAFCFPGYYSTMCTDDLAANSIAQVKDALKDPNDVCGICNKKREITSQMVLGR